jgi:alpha-glucosidase
VRVDGFRLDAVNYMFEDPKFRDNPVLDSTRPLSGDQKLQELKYNKERRENLGILKRMRQLVTSYGEDKVLVSEASVPSVADLMRYHGKGDGVQLPFNFFLSKIPSLNASAFRDQIAELEDRLHGRWTDYVLSNHDMPRAVDRLAPNAPREPVAKLLGLMLLTLRGTPFIYYGEELGMPTVDPKTIDEVRDP